MTQIHMYLVCRFWQLQTHIWQWVSAHVLWTTDVMEALCNGIVIRISGLIVHLLITDIVMLCDFIDHYLLQHQEKARRMEEEIMYGSKPVTAGPKRFAGNTPTKTPSKVRKVHSRLLCYCREHLHLQTARYCMCLLCWLLHWTWDG